MIKPVSRRTSATPPAAPGTDAESRKDDAVGERIGRELRAMFDDVVAEPVPDRFRQLLDELARKSRAP